MSLVLERDFVCGAQWLHQTEGSGASSVAEQLGVVSQGLLAVRSAAHHGRYLDVLIQTCRRVAGVTVFVPVMP